MERGSTWRRRAARFLDDLEWIRGIHRRRTATGLVLDLRVGCQVRTAVDDLDVLKTCREKTVFIVVNPDCSCDATNIGGHALCDGFRKFMLERNIAYSHSSSRL